MLVATASEMRQIDRRAIEEMGIPGLILMENAGRAVAIEALEMNLAGSVLVLAGRGNNGGDGFVAARHLASAGLGVEVWLAGSPDDVKGDARTNLDIYRRMGLPLGIVGEAGDLRGPIERSGLVIDALLGTGFSGEPRQPFSGIIDLVNGSGKPVLAVDLPSGVDADTGQFSLAVNATVTVTLGLLKRGLLLYPGAERAGDIIVADISIPDQAVADQCLLVEVITEDLVRPAFHPRRVDAHKGDFGHVLVVAGSLGFSGAAALTALGALRSGAGLVTVAVPGCIQSSVAPVVKEAMTRGLPFDETGQVRADAADKVLDLAGKASVIAVGPGIGTGDGPRALVKELIVKSPVPLVVDADGLNNLVGVEIRRSDVVLTPHPGEMSRLIGLSIGEVQADRLGCATALSLKTAATVLLKGAPTIVASKGRCYLNLTGNPGMASGGSGDVLTGIIAALVAQGVEPDKAACAGAYVHGCAGDEALKIKGQRGMVSGDLVDCLPGTIACLEGHR